ncbi:MAG: hypothetical protein CSB47_01490 [Proteobacteria bacterium]|nr:MAG: hypothetical protein CSB47_01490 [Pseudomonadota bacterium]
MKCKRLMLITALFIACMSAIWTHAYSKEARHNLADILKQVNQLEETSPSITQSALKNMEPQIQAMESERFDGYQFDAYTEVLLHSIMTSLKEKKYALAKQKNEALQQLVHHFKGNMGSWETAHLVNAASGSFLIWLYTDENQYKQQAEAVLEEGVKNDIATYEAFLNTPLGDDKEFLSKGKSIAAMRHINLYVQGLGIKQRRLGASQLNLQKLALEAREKYIKYKQRLQLESSTTLDKEYNNLLVAAKELLTPVYFKPLQEDYEKNITSEK